MSVYKSACSVMWDTWFLLVHTKSTASVELGRISCVKFMKELVQHHSVDWGSHTDFGDPKCLWLAPFWLNLAMSATSSWPFQRVLSDVAIETQIWNWCAQHKEKSYKSSVLYCYIEIRNAGFTATPLHGCKTCRLKKRNCSSNKVNSSWHSFFLP